MIEDTLTEISERGWYLSSAFHTLDHPIPWRCHIRHPSELISYGQGQSLLEALNFAIDGISNAKHAPKDSSTYTVEAPKVSLSSLINKTKPPMNRRF